MSITTILFDLDGTLLDSFALILAAFRHACLTVLGHAPTDEELHVLWGAPLRTRFAHIAPDRVDDLLAAYTPRYDALQAQLAAPFPGVQQMLETLRTRGLRLGVVTSKRRRSALRDLEVFSLGRHIDTLVAAEDVAVPKPAPDVVFEALRRLQARAEDTWMVGDWTLDIQAARAAAVTAVAALWGTLDRAAVLASGPDYIAERPEDVVRLLSGQATANPPQGRIPDGS